MRKLRTFIVELILVAALVGWYLWKFPETLDPFIPWIIWAILAHLTWEIILEREDTKSYVLGAIADRRKKLMIWVIAFLLGGLISVCYLLLAQNSIKKLTEFEKTRKRVEQSQPEGSAQPTGKSTQQATSESGVSAVTTSVTTSDPVGELARLGWGVKDNKDGTVFDISNKPLPDMQKSAGYFKMLHKPFQLQFQQVPSIAGFKFLAGIGSCVEISISASNVTDLSELHDLKSLRKLSISQTPFTVRTDLDISPIASLVNLKTLNFNMSRVVDLKPLQGLTKLESLNLGGSLVRDMSPVKELRSLKSLDVRESLVTDLSVLSGIQALEELSVDEKQIAGISGFTRIVTLSIISHVPVDMKAVGTLSSLKNLFIWGPPVVDLSPLRRVVGLSKLQISGFGFNAGRSQIIDVEAIGEFGELKVLSLSEVQVDSIRFLAGHNRLVELNLGGLPVNSISELSGLASLSQVSFSDVPIVEISPLLTLPNLTKLTLLRTPARADILSELERRGVKVTIN